MRQLLAVSVIVVAAAAAGPAAPALACSCAGGNAAMHTQYADAVFRARPVAMRVRAAGSPVRSGDDEVFYDVIVTEVWKGSVPALADIETDLGSSCGYWFAIGQPYIVYAYRLADGQLTTDLCSGTQPIKDAAADLAFHGQGAAPGAMISPPSAQPAAGGASANVGSAPAEGLADWSAGLQRNQGLVLSGLIALGLAGAIVAREYRARPR